MWMYYGFLSSPFLGPPPSLTIFTYFLHIADNHGPPNTFAPSLRTPSREEGADVDDPLPHPSLTPQNPLSARKALAVMRKPSCTSELIYKFAPGLVAAITEEAIDFFITAKPTLDAR